MRTHQIQTRLRKLEIRIRSWPTKEDKLMRFLCGVWVMSAEYYLGNPESDEPSSLLRLIGFESVAELQNAPPETRNAHINAMMDQLLAKFGVTQNDELDRLTAATKQMLAGLSESYKQKLQKRVRGLNAEWPIEFAEFAAGFASDPHEQ